MYSTVIEIQLQAVLLFFKEKVVGDWVQLFIYFQKNLMGIVRDEKQISEKMLDKIEASFGHLREIEYIKK